MDAFGLLQEVSRRDEVSGRIVEALDAAERIVGGDLEKLERRLTQIIEAGPAGVVAPCRHIVESGGKRLRPMLCLLSHRAAGGEGAVPIDLAATCELLHNATLLHDDVIDEGEVRRGRSAARVVYGNSIAVLGGDFLLTETIRIVSERGSRFLGPYVETLRALIGGELVQLRRRGSPATTEEEYFEIIKGKTASLFRWSALGGALAAQVGPESCEAIARFGWNMGLAFQIMDDILDFSADEDTLGKNLLADIQEGKMTLPAILSARQSPEVSKLFTDLGAGRDIPGTAAEIAAAVRASGAIEEARERAARHTDQGLEALRDAPETNREVRDVLERISIAMLHRES